MAKRETFSGNPPVPGLAQAVKVGDRIFVAGTTAWREDGPPVQGMEAQMRDTYARIGESLAHFGADFSDVVEQTVFVTDMEAALAARHVRMEVYGEVLPASATVEITKLGRPGLLIEIKVSAILQD